MVADGQDGRVELGDTLRALCLDDDPAAPGMVLMACTADAAAVEARGMAVLEHEVPLAVDTPIYAASLAKLVTARCIHLLAAEGVLHLDDTVEQWFPALTVASSITVRHLLMHRSGLPEYHALRLVAGFTVDDRLEQADVRRLVDGMDTWFEPGTKVSYNNSNFAMLAAIVAAATGRPFAESVRELVFDPAGMTTASLRGHADDVVAGAAHGYVAHPVGFRRAILGLASVGDGGMWWSGNDLVALGRVLLGGDGAVQAMRQQVALPDGSVPGLATGCAVDAGGAWFGGLAEFTGFRAEIRVYDGVAIGAMANRQDAAIASRLDALAAALGLPASPVAELPVRRPGPVPTGVLVGVGGAPWRFQPIGPGIDAASDKPASPAAVCRAEVGGLSFHLVPDGVGWSVAERRSVSAGWEDDALVVRDGTAEIARLQPVGGAPPTADRQATLAGWWSCPSAHAVLRIEQRSGDLWLHRGQQAPELLIAVGEREGRSVLAASWGLVELDADNAYGRIVLHRAEGLRLERIDGPDRSR
jgi:CubicO group peptidase (beta-lactamase class C family)